MRGLKKVAVISNLERDLNLESTRKIVERLKNAGAEIYVNAKQISDAEYFENIEEMVKKAEVAVVLGGDGTIISSGKICAKYNVPVLGLNLGRLGFLVELEKDEYSHIDRILTGDFKIEERMMLSAEVLRDGEKVFEGEALNDAVISKDGIMKMVHLNLKIDGENVNDYYADGLILSTPTGSTAYSLSAGGPVVVPEIKCMIVTPVCAHTITSRPMVISAESKAEVTVDIYHKEEVAISLDGDKNFLLKNNDKINIFESENSVKLIRFEERSFYDILKTKLSERN